MPPMEIPSLSLQKPASALSPDAAAEPPQPGSIEWAQGQMPVLESIRRRFREETPLRGAQVAIVFHLTKEVANLALAIREAGAKLLLIPSKMATVDPLVLAALDSADIALHTPPDEGNRQENLREVLAFEPHLAVDNADLFTLWHTHPSPPDMLGMSVHSRSACLIVDRHWEDHRQVRFPVVAVGSSNIKLELESNLGTGQSVIDALIRVTGLQLSGKKIAVVGYGNVGSGIARGARGLNARVMIVQNSAYRALKAVMDGYDVVPLRFAAREADILLTATGAKNVLTEKHFPLLRDGAFIGNVGRSREEIDVVALARMAESFRTIDHNLTEYRLGGRRLYLMGGGHQFNHIAGGANSSELMDLSLSLHALTLEHLWRSGESLSQEIHPVPMPILDAVGRLKLQHMGVQYLDD